ncbi:MAG: carboxy-terminal-processing protease, carboxyl-terminal processing protease [Candidatus Parcubacteria bacterium]|jgi:carboxyl-terminal processing protease
MNSKIRTQLFGGILFAIVLSFGMGFYIGNGGISFRSTQASEDVDMAPFWKTWNILNEKFVSASTTKQISNEEKVYGAISGMVSSLGDPYTVFFTPEEKEKFDESIEGTFEGVGMEVGIRDKVLTVVAPLKNSPAEKAGIESGDIIVKIDEKDSLNMKVEEAVSLIRGAKGTMVTLTILKKDAEKPLEIKVMRDKIIVPTIETEIINTTFVIRLYSFGATSESEFKAAIEQYQKSGKKRLIIDLRGNPGGYLDSAVDIASWFLPAGKTIVTEDFGSNITPKIFRSKGYNVFDLDRNKMVILIDEGSASASEILAGALQEHGVAKLVGTKSFGKGSVQELIDITKDTALKVTIARWLTPNGKSISAGGLTPDYEVQFDADRFKKHNEDLQLQKALELLK